MSKTINQSQQHVFATQHILRDVLDLIDNYEIMKDMAIISKFSGVTDYLEENEIKADGIESIENEIMQLFFNQYIDHGGNSEDYVTFYKLVLNNTIEILNGHLEVLEQNNHALVNLYQEAIMTLTVIANNMRGNDE